MNKLKRGLMLIGLTELEADVYLKLLKLKRAKVSELAKVTRVTREQLYPLLEKMVKKGFLKKKENKIIFYQVLETEELIDKIKKWKEQQIKTLKELENIIAKKRK